MEYRRDLEFTVAQYSDCKRGLLTLGNKKIIELENNKKIELLPYLIETHYKRGTSKNDPRVRRNSNKAISMISEAYADHYNNAGLDEHWTKEDVERMLKWHRGQSLGHLFLVKWARDIDTNEEFPVGFFTTYQKPYSGGTILWDGELFVLPEYRRYGIGTELVEASFQIGSELGIDFFESLTYEDENGFPLKFWQEIGVDSSDLIHICGNIPEMISNIQKKKELIKQNN